jgi:cell division protein FtsL
MYFITKEPEKMTREKLEAELKRLLLEKEKQEAKLKIAQRQLDRFISTWRVIENAPAGKGSKVPRNPKVKRAITVTKEERTRRSDRMKARWENFRKQKATAGKSAAPKPAKKHTED